VGKEKEEKMNDIYDGEFEDTEYETDEEREEAEEQEQMGSEAKKNESVIIIDQKPRFKPKPRKPRRRNSDIL